MIRSFNAKEQFDKQWLKTTLLILDDNMKDLRTWSVWNEDKYGDQIMGLSNYFETIRDYIADHEKEDNL